MVGLVGDLNQVLILWDILWGMSLTDPSFQLHVRVLYSELLETSHNSVVSVAKLREGRKRGCEEHGVQGWL